MAGWKVKLTDKEVKYTSKIIKYQKPNINVPDHCVYYSNPEAKSSILKGKVTRMEHSQLICLRYHSITTVICFLSKVIFFKHSCRIFSFLFIFPSSSLQTDERTSLKWQREMIQQTFAFHQKQSHALSVLRICPTPRYFLAAILYACPLV